MSVQAMAWVIENSQAQLGDFIVLLMVANHANADGTGAWPSVKTLARESRLSERATQYCLRSLEKLGELTTVTGGGPRGTNSYSVNMKQAQLLRGANSAGVQAVTVSCGNGYELRAEGVHPSAPEPSSTIKEREPSLERTKAVRSHQWPKGFHLTAELSNYASRKGLQNIEATFEDFENHHRGKGSKFVDWERAWYTWVLRAVSWGKNGNGKRAESFSERNVRETTEICRRVGERAEAVLREVAKSIPEPSNGPSVPSLFGILSGPKS